MTGKTGMKVRKCLLKSESEKVTGRREKEIEGDKRKVRKGK